MHFLVLLLPFQICTTFFGITTAQSDLENCMCVPYWQCKEDYSGLIQDAVDFTDIRIRNTIDEMPCMGDFDVCCKAQCGWRNSKMQTRSQKNTFQNIMSYRVLGENNEAEFGEFPWMLGILENKRFRCGASLIHSQLAVTAAHCVSPGSIYKVRAGEWNWESSDEPIPHQDRMVQKVIVHPYYHPNSLRNDIALLLLERPFIITENVGVVCITPQKTIYDYKNCIATGWGKNSYLQGSYQSTLKKVELQIVPNRQCLTSLQNAKLGPYFSLHASFICAGEQDKDTCKGDGGSPLVCPIPGQPGRYEQVGIVSWGLTCGVANTPGVYVNVALFSEWIDTVMQQHYLDTSIYKY